MTTYVVSSVFCSHMEVTRVLLHLDAQVLTSFEGELQGQDDLLAVVSGSGYDMFEWSAGEDIGSTFHPQVCVCSVSSYVCMHVARNTNARAFPYDTCVIVGASCVLATLKEGPLGRQASGI